MEARRDLFLLNCDTYNDYLDTFITENDIRFVRNIGQVRRFVTLGYRSTGDIYTPQQFKDRQALAREVLWPQKRSWILYSQFKLSKDPFLRALAAREKPNAQKIISTIIFLQTQTKPGFQVSSYIDYSDRLRQSNLELSNCDNWRGIFRGKVMLKPRRTDLSFYDEHNSNSSYTDSDNYVVVNDVKHGLMFMHKGDHKMICVDTSHKEYKENCIRTVVFSKVYGYTALYDHVVRKKL
ncbi:cilia- and flagella-associated protein 299-like [Teleopsis dalmanni]|uniref:cilia- and flagella-associated protein 299-like n=1 Tax=Teleopsis dalmanni TaxID=139649 RepID=UPI0018CE7399|nr:cilia- and flagella-associated protein 299-like [Teleopsis dalmanni]